MDIEQIDSVKVGGDVGKDGEVRSQGVEDLTLDPSWCDYRALFYEPQPCSLSRYDSCQLSCVWRFVEFVGNSLYGCLRGGLFEYWWYDGINGKIKMLLFACSRRESCTHNDFHAWTTAAEDCAPWWHGPRYLQIGENRSRHAAWRLLQGSGVVPRPCPSWSSSMSSHVSICKTGNVFPSQLHRYVGSLF